MTTAPTATATEAVLLRQALADRVERTDIAAAGIRAALERALARGFEDRFDRDRPAAG